MAAPSGHRASSLSGSCDSEDDYSEEGTEGDWEDEEEEDEEVSGSATPPSRKGSIVDEVRRLSRRLSQDTESRARAEDPRRASLLADLRGGFKQLGADADEESDSTRGPYSPPTARRSPPEELSQSVDQTVVADSVVAESATRTVAKAKAKPKGWHPGQRWLGWTEKFPHWYEYPLPKQARIGKREEWTPRYPRAVNLDKDYWEKRRVIAEIYRAEGTPVRRLNEGGRWCRAGTRVGELIAFQVDRPADLSSDRVESMPRCQRPHLQRNNSQPAYRHFQWDGPERPMPSGSNAVWGRASSGVSTPR